MLKKMWTMITGILMTMLLTVSVALAATPVEEADMVSRDMDNIYTMYLGMKKSDFMQNFSDVPNWKFSHKYQSPYPYRYVKDQYIYVRGQYTDPVMHGFLVGFDANDNINGIDVMFYTNDRKTAEAIYKVIKANLEKQFGPARYYGNAYLGKHRIVNLHYQTDRLRYKSKDNWVAVEGKEGEKLWINNSRKFQYGVSFQLSFADPNLYHE